MTLFKFFFAIISVIIPVISSMNIQSAYDLYSDLLSNYSTDIRPVHNDSENQEVYVDVYLFSVNRLDEVHGELVVVMSLDLRWHDVKLQWDPMEYEGRYKMEVDITKIWRPSLKLTSPSQKAERIGKEGDKAVVWYNGFVSAEVIETFYSSCSVQIAYFPFDSHTCDIWFSTSEYGQLLTYIPLSPDINTDIYIENVIWAIAKTEVTSISTGYEDNLVIIIHLDRRATFTALNLLTPIIILMFLNSMVFALPAESGERIGFSVTLLLAIAVYMTIISDKLPNSSKPTPVLTYVLVAYLAQSAFICVKTIFTLKIYFRDEGGPISSAWLSVIRIVRCCNPRNRQPGNKIASETDGQSKPDGTQNKHPTDRLTVREDEITYTWKVVSGTLDVFFLIFNVLLSMAIFITFLCLVLIKPFDISNTRFLTNTYDK